MPVRLPASVEGHERLRLFVGLPVPDDAARELAAWAADLDAPDARRVRAEDLHFTIAFLGHRPREDAERVAEILDECAPRAVRPAFVVRRYRETPRVGMLVYEERSVARHGAEHADDIQRRLEEEGLYVRERRPWLPHVTVLRFRTPPRLRPLLPPSEPVTPSETAAYLSLLGSGGAQYEIIHRVQLGR
jgi:RNA 2',3'-cyclic 3'-phosphodiesterase